MKKILLTWYGITDLRASLGLENTIGPMLAALKSQHFDKAVILGYTDKNKQNNDFSHELPEIQEKFRQNDLNGVFKFIRKVSNTKNAHNHFISWIKSQTDTQIEFYEAYLKELNDTDGIYDIANKTFDQIAKMEDEKEVFFYLSPGTPVMAFVWAFAALRHPEIKKSLLVSPVINQPPQKINLPQEWLEWQFNSRDENGNHLKEYDIIFHLFGYERMPSLLGIKQFKSKKHVFIASKNTPPKVMKNFIDTEYGEIFVNPFDPRDVKEKIEKYLSKEDTKKAIGFNLTGGTKMMYAGAYNVCKKINAVPFYFDINEDKLIYLDDYSKEDVKLIKNVETYIKLHREELNITKPGKNTDEVVKRSALTKKLFPKAKLIANRYSAIHKAVENGSSFEFSKKGLSVSLKNLRVEIDDISYSFDSIEKFRHYITGGWLEEFVYISLKPFEGKKIFDLRLGMEIGFKEDMEFGKGFEALKKMITEPYQELDVTFTDGKKLYIVECKAGKVQTEYVEKLHYITEFYGGIKAKGILAAYFEPHSKIVQRKIKEAKNITPIYGQDIKKIINFI